MPAHVRAAKSASRAALREYPATPASDVAQRDLDVPTYKRGAVHRAHAFANNYACNDGLTLHFR